VALNIPHYRQVVKHPMDLGTMAQKLKQGQYTKASEVKKDFDLMIHNCLTFNPTGNIVRDMGISLQREFEHLWRDKEKWEKNERSAQRGNSSGDDDSEDDDDDDEDGGADDASAQTIAALQKQLMDMQNALAGLHKAPKAKKAKSAKPSHKKGGGSALHKHKAAPSKSKPKKVKQVSYEEKQEISEAVGKMTTPQVEELTRIITSNCKKYAEQEEMELEIDDLPNDVQAMLLQYVRSIFGNPTGGRARGGTPDDPFDEDDEFEPERTNKRGGGGAGAKRKKHKPMGKEEQQMAIDNIQKQLAQFQGGGGGAAMPAANGYGGASKGASGDTSGDDESEESEEE
jgi:bromodomain-containing factor 1